ncbi:MAG: hypothetical protein L0G99_01285 [Propionibacteriales bacterium]|nr:hypothetical protein [Propionibacteriales bacterium]
MKRPSDVLALIFGLILSVVGGTLLWVSLEGTVNWDMARIVAPATLVVIGIIGVFLSHKRDQNGSK